MRGVSVCYLTLSLDPAERGVNVCSFTGLDLAYNGIIVCAFTWPERLERGVNDCSFSRLSVLADLGVHEFFFS